MKRAIPVAAMVMFVGLMARADPPPSAPGIRLDMTLQYRFVDCSHLGSAAQPVRNGKYLMSVSGDEPTTLCTGTTCDGGNGHLFGTNFAMLETFFGADGGVPVACLSAADGGDITFTSAQ